MTTSADIAVLCLAANVHCAAAAIERTDKVVSGANAVRMPGPGGNWVIRKYRNGRKYLHLHIRGPIPRVLYSLGGLLRALSEVAGVSVASLKRHISENESGVAPPVPESSLPPVPESSLPPVPESSLATMSIWRIQTAYRRSRVRRACHRRDQLRSELQQLDGDIEHRQEMLILSAESEGTFAGTHPGTTILVSTRIDTVQDPVRHLLSIMIRPTGLERSYIQERVQHIMNTTSKKSNAYDCARSIQYNNHFPLVIGELPLVSSGQIRFCSGDITSYVSPVTRLVDVHAQAIERTFGAKWGEHITAAIGARSLVSYDVLGDRMSTTYKGSVIVSKLLIRVRGEVYPALSIESIVCAEKKSGYGVHMLDLCKALLFSDAINLAKGYIFAQV